MDGTFTVDAAQSTDKRSRKTTSAETKRIKVKFLEASGPGGNDDVVICHNGDIYQYKRGVEVAVPDFVLDTADLAAPKEMDPNTGQMRAIPSFPYQVIR